MARDVAPLGPSQPPWRAPHWPCGWCVAALGRSAHPHARCCAGACPAPPVLLCPHPAVWLTACHPIPRVCSGRITRVGAGILLCNVLGFVALLVWQVLSGEWVYGMDNYFPASLLLSQASPRDWLLALGRFFDLVVVTPIKEELAFRVVLFNLAFNRHAAGATCHLLAHMGGLAGSHGG